MNPIWETALKIRAFDVDANNRLKVSTIFDYFQDAASNDAERRNFGYEVFIPMGLFWVLSWMKIEAISCQSWYLTGLPMMDLCCDDWKNDLKSMSPTMSARHRFLIDVVIIISDPSW